MTTRRAPFRYALAALLLSMSAGPAAAGTVAVTEAWARAGTASAPTGAAYVTVRNTGNEGDRLVGAASPVAERAELHTHGMEKGVMTMQAVPAIELPAGGSVTLRPGGTHVMLIGMKQALTVGSRFPLTLTFEKAGAVTAEVAVQRAGAMGPAGAEAHGGHQGGDHGGDHHQGGHAHPQ